MKNRKFSTIGMAAMMTVLLCLASGITFAAKEGAPMTPDLTAKRENFRKQHEQRITPEKRKSAADALKAERLKVFRAKRAVKQAAPVTSEIK
jgi:hypothetical protein